jgi:hypothetical protein
VTWWNKVVKRPDDDLVKCALRDSLTLANAGAFHDSCWGAAFKKAVLQLDHEVEGQLDNMQTLPLGNLLTRLKTAWQARVWGINTKCIADRPALRATQETKGFKRATYRHWFCHDELEKGQGFAYHVQKPQQIHAIATFRMSAHVLGIERGRHQRIPRGRRFCTCCTDDVVEDEMHVFECPAYADLRQEYAELFGLANVPLTDNAMYTMMNPSTPSHWRGLAGFLIKAFDKRSGLINVV